MRLALAANYHQFTSLAACLDDYVARGIEYVEVPCGGYCGKDYCDPEFLLRDENGYKLWISEFESRGLKIVCLSVQGNYVHPNKQISRGQTQDLVDCIDLAAKLNLDHIVAFSGLPGGSPTDLAPNWPVGGICDDMYEIYEYQWNNVLLPFWKEIGAYAQKRNVKIAIEIHSGMSVHSPHTLLKLRKNTCDVIGANIDMSHLWWQGIDPEAAIRILADEKCIYHIHMRESSVIPDKVDMYGLTASYLPSDLDYRGWVFAAMGYGHSLEKWKSIFNTIREVGYDGDVAIEYDDPRIDWQQGLNRTIGLCKEFMRE